jgi:O-antigen/teichoic acid export membrane protein
VLAAGQLINGATGPVGLLLNMTGHQDDNVRVLGWITLANAALSVPAILLWGPIGTAAVTGLLNAAKNVWSCGLVRRRLGIDPSILAWSHSPRQRA